MIINLTGFAGYAIIILIIAAIAIIYTVIHRHNINKFASNVERSQMEEAQRNRRIAAEAERKKAETHIVNTNEAIIPEITIYSTYDGKQLAYHYNDVQLITSGVSPSRIIPGTPLTLKDMDDVINVYQGDLFLLGSLPENRLAGMVRDWNKANNPYIAYLSYCSSDGKNIQIALAFYEDKLTKFLERNRDAINVKLSGKPDELATITVGSECVVDYDIEKDKYFALLDGYIIGVLPAAAKKYASEHDIEPEDLTVLVSNVEYDNERDRDIISVYIAD